MSLTTTSGPLALTRRGRLAFLGLPVIGLLIALGVVLSMLFASWVNNAQATAEQAPGVDAVTVQVSSGDTLWSIASKLRADAHPQTVMAEISELNNLDSSELQPGDELLVPLAR